MRRKLQRQTKIWKTREGERIRICDMTNEHLMNAIIYLDRKAEKKTTVLIAAAERAMNRVKGDVATATLQRQVEKLVKNPIRPDQISPLYKNLVMELRRRQAEDEEKAKARMDKEAAKLEKDIRARIRRPPLFIKPDGTGGRASDVVKSFKRDFVVVPLDWENKLPSRTLQEEAKKVFNPGSDTKENETKEAPTSRLIDLDL